jgi:hypothetical protein
MCRERMIRCLLVLTLILPATVLAKEPTPHSRSEAGVKKAIIAESINAYPGNCPCPYNSARNGSACGGRSAWSRRGGYAPLCYENDVTPAMMAEWRRTHAQPKKK